MNAARAELLELVKERPVCKLVLNFRDVHYISSGALGMLITLERKLGKAGIRLALCHLNPEMLEVEATKLDQLFVIEDDPAAGEAGVAIPQGVPARSARAEPVILPFKDQP
jgi:anti-anti-sigma factor